MKIHGKLIFCTPPLPPRLLVPVKSFICSQSLIIFLITVFVRERNFRVSNKSQNFLSTTKFVTRKPEVKFDSHLNRAIADEEFHLKILKSEIYFLERVQQSSPADVSGMFHITCAGYQSSEVAFIRCSHVLMYLCHSCFRVDINTNMILNVSSTIDFSMSTEVIL